MSNALYDLVHRPGKVFETLGPDEHWAQGDYEDGYSVADASTQLHHMIVDFHFVMPRLPEDEPGRYPILTVSRGVPAESSGIFLHMTYEPCEQRFRLSSSVSTSELEVLRLDEAPACEYTGEVLHACVLIARNGLFPSITEVFTGQELFGELALSVRGIRRIWGKPPNGTWWITSGAEIELDEEERCFPAGFGLSDLRITVFDDQDEGYGARGEDSGESLPYSGALDHLVGAEDDPFGPDDDWDFGDEESMSDLLHDLAGQLQVLSGGVNTWARRAESLAEETRHLSLQLAQDDEATTRELDRDLYM